VVKGKKKEIKPAPLPVSQSFRTPSGPPNPSDLFCEFMTRKSGGEERKQQKKKQKEKKKNLDNCAVKQNQRIRGGLVKRNAGGDDAEDSFSSVSGFCVGESKTLRRARE
jgi:hypothetical protein